MTPRRRTVLVGEQAISEQSIETAIAAITVMASDLACSIAVLDRPHGVRMLAVTVGDKQRVDSKLVERLAGELSTHFGVVRVGESSIEGLAEPARST